MKLYKHQQQIVDLNPQRHLLAHGTGTGKTVTGLALVKKNKVQALVIVPKALKENWYRTAQLYGLENMITVMSKEEFRKQWQDIPKYPAIIVDEAHYFANLKSQLSRALNSYRKRWQPPFIWLLTATPYLSTPMNIFALATHLGHEWNYWKFFMTFFTQVRMGRRLVPQIKKGIEGELAELVQKIGSTAKLEDLIDVPDQIQEVEFFKLNKDQEKAIKELTDTNFIVRWTKAHQIENGVLYGGPYDDEPIKHFSCDKTERIKDLVVANKKIAIFCRYNGQVKYLAKELASLGKPIFIITGDVKDRDSVVQTVEASDEAVVLINSSCSEGYELKSIRVAVFASLSFSYKDFVQAQGRFLRIDNPQKNAFIILVAEGVDKAVYEAIRRKEDFSLKIFECDSKLSTL